MINRCANPNADNYRFYGGRGIKVAQEWLENSKSFVEWALKNGYKENLEIDRIDNDGDYTPQNCRWVTRLKNANNKRNNHYITYNGETKTIAQWALFINLKSSTLQVRLNRGWSVERALTERLHKKNKKDLKCSI
jgi:hypothetical protein